MSDRKSAGDRLVWEVKNGDLVEVKKVIDEVRAGFSSCGSYVAINILNIILCLRLYLPRYI